MSTFLYLCTSLHLLPDPFCSPSYFNPFEYWLKVFICWDRYTAQLLRDYLLHAERVWCFRFAKYAQIKGELSAELTTVYDLSEEYLSFQKSHSLCCWISEKMQVSQNTRKVIFLCFVWLEMEQRILMSSEGELMTMPSVLQDLFVIWFWCKFICYPFLPLQLCRNFFMSILYKSSHPQQWTDSLQFILCLLPMRE